MKTTIQHLPGHIVKAHVLNAIDRKLGAAASQLIDSPQEAALYHAVINTLVELRVEVGKL